MTPVIAAYAEEPLHGTSSLARPAPLKKKQKGGVERGVRAGGADTSSSPVALLSLFALRPAGEVGGRPAVDGGRKGKSARFAFVLQMRPGGPSQPPDRVIGAKAALCASGFIHQPDAATTEQLLLHHCGFPPRRRGLVVAARSADAGVPWGPVRVDVGEKKGEAESLFGSETI